MRSQTYVLTTLLVSAASIVWAGPLEARSGLMKRHYWCNGVDSEDICPPGESMVPIDQYACDHIAAAGRLNDITAPVNGETHTDCAGSETHTTDDPPTPTSTTPPSSPTPPVQTGDKSGTGSSGNGRIVHLKCTKTGGSGDDTDLDCTFVHSSK